MHIRPDAIRPRESSGDERPIRLLLTGFGPFGKIKENPSSLAARHLDAEVLSCARLDGSDLGPEGTSNKRKVEVTFRKLQTVYADMAKWIPEQHQSGKWDAMIHVGVAAGYERCTLETGSNRLGYSTTFPDFDGKFPPEVNGGHGVEGDVDRWSITFDSAKMLKFMKEENGFELLRESDDPGNYLCGFSLATSLKWAHEMAERNGGQKGAKPIPVIFIHVGSLKAEGGPYTELELSNLLRSAVKWVGGVAEERI